MSLKDNRAACSAQEGFIAPSVCSASAVEAFLAPPPFPGLDAPIALDMAVAEAYSQPAPAAGTASRPPFRPKALEEEHSAPGRRIRCIDLFITRTGPLVDPERGDYRVVLHLCFGSSIRQASVLIPYAKAPRSWDAWSRWFQPFVGVRSDEAMSVLYYDAEWISDHRDRLLRKTLEPSSQEGTLFPATAFWRRNALIETSDIHIRLSL